MTWFFKGSIGDVAYIFLVLHPLAVIIFPEDEKVPCIIPEEQHTIPVASSLLA